MFSLVQMFPRTSQRIIPPELRLQERTLCHSQDLARLIVYGFDISCVWIGVLGFPHAVACCRRTRSSGSRGLQLLDSTNIPPALISLPSGHKTGQTDEKVSYYSWKTETKTYLDPSFHQMLDLQPRRFWSCRHLLQETLELASLLLQIRDEYVVASKWWFSEDDVTLLCLGQSSGPQIVDLLLGYFLGKRWRCALCGI